MVENYKGWKPCPTAERLKQEYKREFGHEFGTRCFELNVMKAHDLKERGFYWMRKSYDDGSDSVVIVEFADGVISSCGSDVCIFILHDDDAGDGPLNNCVFFGPITPPEELFQP